MADASADIPLRRPSVQNGLPPRPIPRPSRPAPPIPPGEHVPRPPPTIADGTPAVVVLADGPRAVSPEPLPATTAADGDDGDNGIDDSLALTPVRAHYLKKSLIQLQFHHELAQLSSPRPPSSPALSYLGHPFARPPRDDAVPLDVPFARYAFRQLVCTFPFLAAAPPDFFPDKVQPFVGSLIARNLFASSFLPGIDEADGDAGDGDGNGNSGGGGGGDDGGAQKMLAKAERSFALVLNYALKVSEREQVVRLSQRDLDRLEHLARRRRARALRAAGNDAFDVNVVSVRAVAERGRVRSRVHEEFIIRLRRHKQPDVFVSRRYGDFKTLAEELRKRHPDELIRPPPAKDKTAVTTSGLTPSSSVEGSTDSLPTTPTSPLSGLSPGGGGNGGNGGGRLAREKNRLTLRAYLHALLAQPALASSPVMHSFLTSSPTALAPAELADAARRADADRQREEGRAHFAAEVAARVDRLRETVKGFKGSLLGEEGLTHLFAVLKTTENVRDLPPDFRAAIEWGRISLASTVFHHYVAVDDASENFAGLKRIHGLVPYFLLKSALKISNPVGMIRSVLDLFMAQPFGGRSLLQRMFTSSLYEEVRVLEEEIAAVQDKVDDAVICEKVRQFVHAPREIQSVYKLDADEERVHIFTAILRSPEEPTLNRAQLQRIFRAQRAHTEYARHRAALVDSDDDDGPTDEHADAWLFEDLAVLARLHARLRDKRQLIELIFEGTTADLLRDIITIFYTPLAQVYRAASIADSIGDLQNFVNDLIKTVEATEDLAERDPKKTVQIFIDLVERHEQSFYSFVHRVHSKGEGLFTGLMKWLEFFLTLAREGLGEPVPLEALLPHSGPERARVVAEIDAVALYHYRLKVAYEAKVRRRFGADGDPAGVAEDEAARAIVDGLVRDFSYGDVMREDALDAAAEDAEEEGDDDEDDDDEAWSSGEDGDSDESGSDDSDEYSTASDDSGGASDDAETPRASAALARAHTVPAPRPPDKDRTPTAPSRQLSQATLAALAKPPPPTTRLAGSLRRARSTSAVGPASRSLQPPPPPVPPLPLTVNKPLPPDPTRSSRSVASSPSPPARQKKSRPPGPKPPDLEAIPELLPLFVEMARPLLVPKRIT